MKACNDEKKNCPCNCVFNFYPPCRFKKPLTLFIDCCLNMPEAFFNLAPHVIEMIGSKVVLPFDLSVPAREARDTCIARVEGTQYLTSYY